jgi:transposase
VFDIPKKLIEVYEYQTEKKTCKNCGCVNKSKFPEEVKNKTQYGNRIKAILVYFIQYQLISYKRLKELSSDIFGQSISEGTIYNANLEAYDKLEKSENSIKEAIVNEKVVNFDETGIRVNSLNYWIHVSCTKDYTFYGVDRHRNNDALKKIDILTKFKGVAIHDNYSMYFKYEDCNHGLCNAHHYRELKGAFDEDGFLWLSQMTDLLFRIKKAVDTSDNIDSLDTKQLFEFEKEYIKILEEGSKNYPIIKITEKKRGRTKLSKSQNLFIRFIKRRDEILRFMYNFSVPFDNNQAERDIRMPKLKQKISGCFRSNFGAEIFCRNRGYISTVKKQKLNVLQSICDIFSNNPFTA